MNEVFAIDDPVLIVQIAFIGIAVTAVLFIGREEQQDHGSKHQHQKRCATISRCSHNYRDHEQTFRPNRPIIIIASLYTEVDDDGAVGGRI